MAENHEAGTDGVPGTPGIMEARPETGIPGIRMVNCRAVIDTSPPFESVKEAVTRFGGSGPWLPLYKLGEAFQNSIEDFDIKKVEEQAAELEKDLIVKELETLDVLEELGATKKIVEDLKQQLKKEAMKCIAPPDVHTCEQAGNPIAKENSENTIDSQGQVLQSSDPCPMSSADLILMDIKQAKVDLGKAMSDLGVIQSSVESLNKKMKKEKFFLMRTREKLASKFAAVSAQERDQEQSILNPSAASVEASCTFNNPVNITRSFNPDAEQQNRMVETKNSEVSKSFPPMDDNGLSMKTAEMRWFAAKKMEEAARAAEAIALAEIKALSSTERSSGVPLPEPRRVTFDLREHCSLIPKAPEPEESTLRRVIETKFHIDETNISKLTILNWLEEASTEVLHSKQVLTEALNRIETANSKQHAAKEALRRLLPDGELKGQAVHNPSKSKKLNPCGNYRLSPLPDVMRSKTPNNDPKPVLRSTVSLRDVLRRRPVPEEYPAGREMEDHSARQKVALSQMLRALREDLTLGTDDNTETDKDRSSQKHFVGNRKKFGFIHISLPLSKPNKKRA
ncbi:hypothetical protein QN277_017103 [Acacia crassicarpa]|uniref:WEB family protein n=1 Tax=Acacia crassicarpa TaxID=499986 RepID=A0AAE1JNI4_9FABA|nr:hypothetical protein QN277_017103 [Acacia crassicarpa]